MEYWHGPIYNSDGITPTKTTYRYLYLKRYEIVVIIGITSRYLTEEITKMLQICST